MIRDAEQAQATREYLDHARDQQPEPPGTCTLAEQLGSWDAGYGVGYANGKDKALAEVRDRLQDAGGHHARCGCGPCGLIREVLAAGVG